jgi:hypothetical protein
MIFNSPQKINFLVQRSRHYALSWRTDLLARIPARLTDQLTSIERNAA